MIPTCTYQSHLLHTVSVWTCTNPAMVFYTDGSVYAARCRCHHPDDRIDLSWEEVTRKEYEVAQVMED